jgi:O-antigen/teichoic acid export membrane protein
MTIDNKKEGLVSALGWTVGSNIAQEGILSLVTLLLASLLKPSDFGTVAMALIYINFVQMIMGFGFSTAIIQKAGLTPLHLNSLFWLILSSSFALGGVSVLLSGWWARVNHIPDLKLVLIALAALVPLQGLTVVQQALFQREMNFKTLALRNNLSAILGGAVGIALAFLGFGVWALVAQHLARDVSSLIVLWSASSWRPAWQFSIGSVTDLLAFSAKVFAGNLGAFTQAYADSLLMGMLFGPTAVGIYRMADRLVEMALKLITRAFQVVSLPHFSKIQHDTEEINRSLGFFYRTTGLITIPALFFLAFGSSTIMSALGPQWASAAGVLRVLCIVGFVKGITLFIGPLLQAVGKPAASAFSVWCLTILNTAAVLIVVLLFQTSSADRQSLAVAWVRAAFFVGLFLPLTLILARRFAKVRLVNLASALLPGLAVGCAVAVLQILILGRMGTWRVGPVVSLSISGAVAGVAMAVAALAFSQVLRSKLQTLLRKIPA